MPKPKIVVIGAGPAGSAFAVSVRKLGAAEVVLVDKSSYPRVKVCGSGLSPLALEMLDVLHMKDRFPKHASICGLEAKAPGGATMTLQSGEGAWVVPRHEFDHALVREAEGLGASFLPETKATELLRDGETIRGVRTSQGDLEADLVVCADGAASRFSIDPAPRRTIQTLMGWWAGSRFPRDRALMVWDRRLAGYYAWVFPEPEGVVNIGLCIPDEAPDAARLKDLFQDLLDEHFADRLAGAEQLGKWMGHPAVITNRLGPISTDRALWIGEAARLVMPGTVEGIGFALQNGIDAARFVSTELRADQGLSGAAQRRYRMRVARKVLPKFWAGTAFVGLMQSPLARHTFAKIMNDRVKKLVQDAAARMTGDPLSRPSGDGSASALSATDGR